MMMMMTEQLINCGLGQVSLSNRYMMHSLCYFSRIIQVYNFTLWDLEYSQILDILCSDCRICSGSI